MNQRLTELQLEEFTLAQKYNDRYPELLTVRGQIKYLKGKISQRKSENSKQTASIQNLTDPTQQNLKLQMQTAKAELESQVAGQKSLETEIAQTRQELDKLLGREREVQNLEREIAILDQEHTQYINSQRGAEISLLLDKDRISNVKVIQGASFSPISKKNIRKLLAVLVFGSLMGLGAGIILALGLDFVNSTLWIPEEVERHLGLPVMASIPQTQWHHPMTERHQA